MAIKKMWTYINETLLTFRKCFSREATFRWFVTAVVGFMTWQEHKSVTSFVRELYIAPQYYETFLHFFRSNAWQLDELRNHWINIVKSTGLLFYESSMPILIGDGVKQSKEARKMPCVKKLHQESENSSKAAYIFGHMFGGVGILIGNASKLFCLPLSMTIQDGDKQIYRWMHDDNEAESHVVRMIREAANIASMLKPSILLLDRYFLTVPALMAWIDENKQAGSQLLHIITKAKSNAVAYEKPERKKGKGRPPKKGKAIKLKRLFTESKDSFTKTNVKMYGKDEKVSFLCVDLLWGKKLYQELRFVLVNHGSVKSIFVSTNLSFSPEQIIRLYSYRFKIECCFRELKQVVSGFSYHFWSIVMPKLNHFSKSGTDPLENINTESGKRLIISAYKAIHGFTMVACIAIGLLQICSIRFGATLNNSVVRWLRTKTNNFPSEASVADILRKSIFYMFRFKADLPIIRFILDKQKYIFGESEGTSA